MTTNRVDTNLPEHSWIPFYEELTHKLLNEGWRNRQPELVQMLKKMKKDGVVPLPKVIDALDDHIDPFSFYGTISRSKVTEQNIERAMISFKSKFDLKSNLPLSKPFIPYINPQTILFFDTQCDSRKEDISTLWDVFKCVVKAGTSDGLDSEKLVGLMDAGLGIKGVGISKLTMGLYWMNPYRFLHVDTVNAVGGKDLGIKATDGASYLQCLKRTREIVQCAFPNLNIPVWVLGDDHQECPKVWVVRADQSRLAGDFVDNGYIIGWEPHKTDMSSIKTRKEIVDIYDGLIPQLESFLLKTQIGDYVIALGLNRDFYYGIVTSGLFFSEQETRREVDWIDAPLPKDDLTSTAWYNPRTVFEFKGTDRNGTNRRNQFFKLIGRDDLIETDGSK